MCAKLTAADSGPAPGGLESITEVALAPKGLPLGPLVKSGMCLRLRRDGGVWERAPGEAVTQQAAGRSETVHGMRC